MMLKRTKVLAYLATFVGGALMQFNCGLDGFWRGFFGKGMFGNPIFDAITDIIREDVFG